MLPSQRGQQLRVAAPPLAKVEVIARHDVRDTQFLDQIASDEVFRLHRRQVTVKRDYRTEPCTKRFDQRRLERRRRQPEQRLFRLEDRARMWFERHHARGHATAGRLVQRTLQQRLMALVQPVEVANGNSSTTQLRRDGCLCIKRDHEGRGSGRQGGPVTWPLCAATPGLMQALGWQAASCLPTTPKPVQRRPP
jgi:hypothetical protein